MFFAPSGSFHAIENLGDEPAEFPITFSNEMPEDSGITRSPIEIPIESRPPLVSATVGPAIAARLDGIDCPLWKIPARLLLGS